jgi:signal peptidase I
MEEDKTPPPATQVVSNPLPPAQAAPRGAGWRGTVSTVAVLLLAPLLAILLTVFVFQSYQVDGPSMRTTLFNNDRLIVWKFGHTWARLTGHDYIPNRGDIIIFTDPHLSELNQDPSKQLIKRVIALPGERLVISDGVVTVYNQQHPNGFHPDTDLPYRRIAVDTAGTIDVTIPAGQLFVLGDNRTNSEDSRIFGPIEAKNIIGKLVIRILPLSNIKRF